VSRERQARTGGRGQSTLHWNRFSLRALVALVLFLLLFGSPAAADPCALTDPDCITETVDESVTTAKETITDAEQTVEQAAGSAGEAVEEAAAGVVSRVNEVIDGLLGKKKEEPGGGGGGKDSPRANRPPSEQSRRDESPAARRLEPREPSFDAFLPRAGVGVPGAGPASNESRPGGIGAAARQLAFPALLVVLVLAFLVIQNRVDRQDPRLASAPLGPDLLTFE
jgi:hypothetical protein